MIDTIKKISKLNDDLNLLKGNYEYDKIWVKSYPDGDLKFEMLMEWLSDDANSHSIEKMIKVIKDIKALENK
jgi:hypothetical protein